VDWREQTAVGIICDQVVSGFICRRVGRREWYTYWRGLQPRTAVGAREDDIPAVLTSFRVPPPGARRAATPSGDHGEQSAAFDAADGPKQPLPGKRIDVFSPSERLADARFEGISWQCAAEVLLACRHLRAGELAMRCEAIVVFLNHELVWKGSGARAGHESRTVRMEARSIRTGNVL
jgi:hypothetical protein